MINVGVFWEAAIHIVSSLDAVDVQVDLTEDRFEESCDCCGGALADGLRRKSLYWLFFWRWFFIC